MDNARQREIEGYARVYRLRLPERQKVFMAGDVAGKRAGSSIEYQDRKDYVPGDDIRHVDWRAYARNDRLTIKLYREEISPRMDIVIDTSSSMDTSPEKGARAVELAFFFHLLADQLHAVSHIHNLGERLVPIRHPFEFEKAPRRRVKSPLPILEGSAFPRRGGIKILVSDFLFPCEPRELRNIFSGADRLILVQLLSAFESRPELGGEMRLSDAETDEYLDISLNSQNVKGYLDRLEKLREGFDRQTRMVSGAFATLRDIDPLDEVMRALLRAGVIEA
jgi:uncharacterized protein (DUF58 family)